MQKVEGSSPFSRFGRAPLRRGFSASRAVSAVPANRRRIVASAHWCPINALYERPQTVPLAVVATHRVPVNTNVNSGVECPSWSIT